MNKYCIKRQGRGWGIYRGDDTLVEGGFFAFSAAERVLDDILLCESRETEERDTKGIGGKDGVLSDS